MKNAILLIALLSLCACCKPDPGDKTDIGSYWDGCWGTWKEGNKQQILFPRGNL